MTQTDFEIPSQVLRALLTADRAKAVIVLRLEDNAILTREGALDVADFNVLAFFLLREAASINAQDQACCFELSLGGARCLVSVQPMIQDRYLLGGVFAFETPLPVIRQEMMKFTSIIGSFIEVNTKSDPAMQRSLGLLPIVDESTQRPDLLGTNLQTVKNDDPQMSGEWVHLSGMPDIDNRQAGLAGEVAKEAQPATVKITTENELALHTMDDHIELSDRYFFSEDAVVKMPPDTWLTLNDHSEPGEDLASLFQDGFSLKEVYSELGDVPILTEGTINDEAPYQDHQPGIRQSSDNVADDLLPTELIVSDVTFYLTPYLSDQYLFGDLSKRLRQWLPQICRKYGWELIALSVRPDCLRWTLSDFPEALILEMLKIVRRETSELIFGVFPGLKVVYRPGDYWAPGYRIDR